MGEKSVIARDERDNSPLGVVIVAVALGAVVALVFYLWWQLASNPPLSSERYYPLPQGATFTYRLRQPDGSITYRSRNIARQPLDWLIGNANESVFYAALGAAEVELTTENTAQTLDLLSRFRTAKITDVEYNARSETLRRTESLALILEEGVVN